MSQLIAPSKEVSIAPYFGFMVEPTHIETRESAYEALGVTRSPGTWFEKDWSKKESEELIFAANPDGGLFRFERVITLYAKRELAFRNPDDPAAQAKRTVQVLRETIQHPNGRVEEREFNNTVSETIRGAEHPLQTVRRCVCDEELHLRMTARQRRRYLNLRPLSEKPPHLYVIRRHGFRYDDETGLPYEAYMRRVDPKRPNTTTLLAIYHFAWLVPKVFWRPQYREPQNDGRVLIFHWEDAETRVPAPGSPGTI
jgi:hypothetical protein